jgi:hypothetical protein
MRSRLTILTLLLLLCTGLTASAQGMTQFCDNLPQEDCDILTQSQSAMMTLESATFDFNAQFVVGGEQETQTLGLTGTGAFSGAGMMGMAMMNDPAMMSDPAAMLNAFAGALGNFDAELNLQVMLPDEAMNMESLDLQLRLVDGIGYINFDALRASMGESGAQMGGTELTGWGGLNLVEVFTRLNEQGMLQGMQGQMQTTPPDMEAYMALVQNYVTVERLPDVEGAAVFQTTMDLAGLYADPAFWETMGMSEAGSDPQMAQMGNLFEGASFVSTTTIGLEDYYIRAVTMNMVWNMPTVTGTTAPDTGMMPTTDAGGTPSAMTEGTPEAAPGVGGAAPDGSMVPNTLNVSFTMTFDNFNSAPAITAPENATIAETDQVLGMLMGGGAMGGSSGMGETPMPMVTPTATP